MPVPRPSLMLGDTTVMPDTSHKFLGVLLDQELRWREQAERVVVRATKWSLSARRLARPAMGISPWLMRQLYQAVALPCFTYAADVWFTLVTRDVGGGKARGLAGVVCRLVSVQQISTIAVTSALHTSATDILELHANLPPIKLLMHKICHRATLRLAALPECHPLHKLVRQCAHRDVKRHRSPLHQLLHTFTVHPGKVEMVMPMVHPPNKENSFCMRIASTREESHEEDHVDQVEVHANTDS